VVYINDMTGDPPRAGDFRAVEITQALDYDLVGKLI
jgi:hypothetical protein